MGAYLACYLIMLLQTWHPQSVQCDKSTTCPRDQYLDSQQGCRMCTSCQPGTQVIKQCTNQTDTVCNSCKEGTFSADGRVCRTCTRCPPGTYVYKHCNSTVDGRCKICPSGTFASGTSSKGCTRCRECYVHETVKVTCNTTHDYQCGDCIEGYFKYPRRPRLCLRCSPCYNSTASLRIPDCANSKKPDHQCMPGTYGAAALSPQPDNHNDKGNNFLTSTSTYRTSASTPGIKATKPTAKVVPLLILTAIISTSVVVLCVIFICLSLKFRRNIMKLAWKPKGINVRTVQRQEEKQHDSLAHVSAEVDEPIVSCNQCILHYRLESIDINNVSPNLTVQTQTSDDNTDSNDSAPASLMNSCPSNSDSEHRVHIATHQNTSVTHLDDHGCVNNDAFEDDECTPLQVGVSPDRRLGPKKTGNKVPGRGAGIGWKMVSEEGSETITRLEIPTFLCRHDSGFHDGEETSEPVARNLSRRDSGVMDSEDAPEERAISAPKRDNPRQSPSAVDCSSEHNQQREDIRFQTDASLPVSSDANETSILLSTTRL